MSNITNPNETQEKKEEVEQNIKCWHNHPSYGWIYTEKNNKILPEIKPQTIEIGFKKLETLTAEQLLSESTFGNLNITQYFWNQSINGVRTVYKAERIYADSEVTTEIIESQPQEVVVVEEKKEVVVVEEKKEEGAIQEVKEEKKDEVVIEEGTIQDNKDSGVILVQLSEQKEEEQVQKVDLQQKEGEDNKSGEVQPESVINEGGDVAQKTNNENTEEIVEILKPKLIIKHSHKLKIKVEASDKNSVLSIFDYEECHKFFYLKLKLHLQDGRVLTKTVKVDLNDGLEARLAQIKSELLDQFSSNVISYYVEDKQLKFIEEKDFSDDWIKEKQDELVQNYNKAHQENELITEVKVNGQNQEVSEEVKIEEVKIEEVKVEEVKEEVKIEEVKVEVKDQEELIIVPGKFCEEPEVEELVSNKKGEPKPKYPIDLNLYTLTQTPKSFKLPKNILVVNSKTKIAHLVTDASQDLVLEVTIGNKLVEKKLKITQTYDKILNAGNKWPSLRFYSDKTIILRGFALYGPNPVYIDQSGYNFEIRAYNISTKQESFSLCKQIGGLPKHHKYFLDTALVVNSGDLIDIRPQARLGTENTVDLVGRLNEKNLCFSNKFVEIDESAFQNFTDIKVISSFGSVYNLQSSSGIVYGQDGVKFSIENKDNIGLSGLYYESVVGKAK